MLYPRIKELRIDHDILEKQVASYIGCTQQQYSEYESGKREPKLYRIALLAEFYSTSVDYILGLTDTTKPYPRKK